ncbi:DUF6153 family protein [Rhodococcus sp. USK13]|uniref:DUF6153 family protein n=1 Tax=Rhodococcus sp. USK13 TaxID=2806442 RepID=UPI001BCC8385|nr:DUF6153 family protein [Rhodococcus sp. USK13]
MTPAARRRRVPTARIALLVTVAAAVLVMHSVTAASAPAHDGSLHAVAASHDPGTNHGHDCGNECEQSHPNGHHCAGVVVVAPVLTRATVPCVAGAEAPSPTSRVSVDRVQSGLGPPAWTVLSLAQLSILRV